MKRPKALTLWCWSPNGTCCARSTSNGWRRRWPSRYSSTLEISIRPRRWKTRGFDLTESGGRRRWRLDRPRPKPFRLRPVRKVKQEERQDESTYSRPRRSEEHTSELQSLMRISYAVFCLKKKKAHRTPSQKHNH